MPKKPTDSAVLRRREAFGRRLRAVREQVGMSQTAVAVQAGMDRSFYADAEAARHSISIDKVFAIADALGVHVTELFADPESPL